MSFLLRAIIFVQMNGTQKRVTLIPGQALTLEPALLTVKSPVTESLNVERSLYPPSYSINGHRWLDLDSCTQF